MEISKSDMPIYTRYLRWYYDVANEKEMKALATLISVSQYDIEKVGQIRAITLYA